MNRLLRNCFAILGTTILLSLWLVACETGANATTPPPLTEPTAAPPAAWSADSLMPIIEAAAQLQPKAPVNSVEVVDTQVKGDYQYIQEKHNVIANRESVLFLGQNDDVLFPGAIIRGNGIYDFVYHPIIAARAPIILSISLEGVPTTGESIVVTVDDPSRLSNVRQGVNDLVKSSVKAGTKVPAKFDYMSEQVYSSSEKNLTLGVSGSYADVSVNYDFNWKSEKNKNKILSVYRQTYYTVDADLPANPYDFFDPAAGVAALAEDLPGGSMPVYVSSVSYGWMALLFIETDFSKDEMEMSLAAAYDPAGDMEAKMDFGYSAKNVLQSSKIQILVYGGSTGGITNNTLSGYSGLMELIQRSKDFGADSPAVPLSYRLRHLSNNLIAKVALTEEYTVTKAVRLREFVKVTLDKFECTYDNDNSGKLDMDRFFFWVKLYQGQNQIRNDKIVDWYNKKDFQMGAGDSWTPDNIASTVVMLDLKQYDPGAYNFVLTAEARDYDPIGADDWAKGSFSIAGSAVYDENYKFFEIKEANNMTFNVYYSIQPATLEDCLTYPNCKKQVDAWTPPAAP